jgi:bla regulator protein blaR1
MIATDLTAWLGRLAANHLWQSTAVAAVAVMLAFALRRNRASVRHWLWLTASMKFLIPFSVVASVGGSFGRWVVPATPAPRLPLVVEQMVQPFAMIHDTAASAAPMLQEPAAPGLLPSFLLALWFCGFVAVVLYGWVRWRRVAAAVRAAAPITEGREMEALRRIQGSGSARLPRLVSSKANLEPSVVGVFTPVVCLPAAIVDRLDDAELGAILAHELCHIRRRDNLTAAIHMAVEAIFWFHPLVWWLGARLTEERERACDEEVVRMGGEPHVYAESILKVCEFYLASPVACAAGITGGELKKRIEGIMMKGSARKLSLAKKLMLATAAVAAVSGPLAIGIVSAGAQTPSKAQTFEVAMLRMEDPHTTVDYNRPDSPNQTNKFPLNRYTMFHTMLKSLISTAYGVPYNKILGGPAWLESQHYDLSAKAPGDARISKKQMEPMLQNLLKERLHLPVHSEHRIVPGYAMVIAKGGSKLKANTGAPFGGMDAGFELKFQNASPEMIAHMVESKLKQPVVDKTGLAGTYDFHLIFTRDREAYPNDVPHADFGDIFGALQAQLGLKLVKQQVPVDYLVIDHVERAPTEN